MKEINLAYSYSTNKKKIPMKELNLNEVKQITGGRNRPKVCPKHGCIVESGTILGKVKYN